jgi:hypothetical protein
MTVRYAGVKKGSSSFTTGEIIASGWPPGLIGMKPRNEAFQRRSIIASAASAFRFFSIWSPMKRLASSSVGGVVGLLKLAVNLIGAGSRRRVPVIGFAEWSSVWACAIPVTHTTAAANMRKIGDTSFAFPDKRVEDATPPVVRCRMKGCVHFISRALQPRGAL